MDIWVDQEVAIGSNTLPRRKLEGVEKYLCMLIMNPTPDTQEWEDYMTEMDKLWFSLSPEEMAQIESIMRSQP